MQALSNSEKQSILRIAFKSSNFVLPYEMMQKNSEKENPISVKEETISVINGENSKISANDRDNLVIREESKRIPVM